MHKTIMVLLDGLRYDTTVTDAVLLGRLAGSAPAARYKVRSELPSVSRPLYEVLLTGTPCSVHGILANDTVRLSNQVSLFQLAIRQGLVTAAAAYSWVSELYNRAPFLPVEDREQHGEGKPIQHGKFYFEDGYPDSHLFLDGEILRRDWDPDFLLIHPMGIDDAGHRFGGDSDEYRSRARAIDGILAALLPDWLACGYTIVVTSDHGMTDDGRHGGATPAEREVPLVCMGPSFAPGLYAEIVPQLAVAPLLCRLLSLPPAPAMGLFDVPGFEPN